MATPRHWVAAAVHQMRTTADSVTGASVWSMDPEETTATLLEVTRLKAQVAELELRVAGHAQSLDLGAEQGATSTANWWAHTTRQTRPAAHGAIRLAVALAEDRHAPVRAALAAGDLNLEQARVIIGALEALPKDLDPDLVGRAEAHLVEQAGIHDPKALRILGRRLFEVIAPDQADAHEAELLEAEERRAAAKARFQMHDQGDGTSRGWFTLPALQAGMLRTALLALAAPKHHAATKNTTDDPADDSSGEQPRRRPGPERLGRAFCEYIERYPVDRLPHAGGVAATVVVTLDLATLTAGLDRAGLLDTGDRISPGQARRLACEAGIIPLVLGGPSQPLDAGRQSRLYRHAQRTAIALRDGGCTTEGCDWPPGMCHVHHDHPWAQGGNTDLDDGRLLCPPHHTLAHDPNYQMTRLPNGKVRFHRRT
jgi:hypothetical protein